MSKPKLLISFSGGKTSGYMTRKILQNYSNEFECAVVFANTGQENEETLNFVNNCDKMFGFNVVWVEALVNPEKRKGTRHKIVTFETASRNGEPFEAVMAKYGISNFSHPHCTREMKRYPIDSWANEHWQGEKFQTAIGIRTDEKRRVSPSQNMRKIVYPLIEWFPSDKQDVNTFWEEQPFNLNLLEHEGNCKWCWKKSATKHARLAIESPEVFEFPARMEKLYGMVGPEKEHIKAPQSFPRAFFRYNRNTEQMLRFVEGIKPWEQTAKQEDDNSGCSESCEMYPMEAVE